MAQILTAIYLLMMLAAGWRLFGLGWKRSTKAVVAVLLVCPLPLLILLPGMIHPDRPFGDLLRMIGFVLMGCGALCLVGGMSAARLRARRR